MTPMSLNLLFGQKNALVDVRFLWVAERLQRDDFDYKGGEMTQSPLCLKLGFGGSGE